VITPVKTVVKTWVFAHAMKRAKCVANRLMMANSAMIVALT